MKLLLSFLLLLNFAYANQELESDSFIEMEKMALKLGKKHGIKNTLVVFDIDNTILKMPQFLGSDMWWGWQEKNCVGKKTLIAGCATSSFSGLLKIQGELFALSNMAPTEKSTVSVVKRLQDKGFKVILLTSRGPNFRSATEDDVKENKMHFVQSAIGPKNGYAGTYTPYDLKNFKAYGLTKADMDAMGNKSPRPVSFQNGIFMTAGLNKGIMLKTLLNKTNSKFKAIVFADDHIKHTKRMHQIMGKVKGVDLVTYRYSKIDPDVKAFNESDKNKVNADLDKFMKLKKELFNN